VVCPRRAKVHLLSLSLSLSHTHTHTHTQNTQHTQRDTHTHTHRTHTEHTQEHTHTTHTQHTYQGETPPPPQKDTRGNPHTKTNPRAPVRPDSVAPPPPARASSSLFHLKLFLAASLPKVKKKFSKVTKNLKKVGGLVHLFLLKN
jgi:hypothetical protein